MAMRSLSLVMAGAWITVLVAVVMASSAPVAANEDGDALMALVHNMKDPDGVLTGWDPSMVNPCTWLRVMCNDDNRVETLVLRSMRLSGTLPPELGKLEQLQYMEMSGNNLQGPIPSEFGNLKNLISMDLYNNDLSGPLPTTLGNLTSLKIMRIDHNRLTGPIPKELSGLPNLVTADFSSNDFCGTIPTTGPFKNIPLTSFSNNPRLKQGPVNYDANC